MREHLRKQRRDERRNPNAKRKKRDPGIPNSWPFKQQLLAEQEAVWKAAVLERVFFVKGQCSTQVQYLYLTC